MTVLVTDQERREWLAQRGKHIGASEVAAILGVDPRRGQLALYALKTGAMQTEDSPAMRWGRKAEALVAEAYGEETGRPVLDPDKRIHRHPALQCLGASLDRLTAGSEAHPAPIPPLSPRNATVPLECKVVNVFKADEWRDEPPLQFVVQVQMQMACTGAQWASLVAMIGWPPRPTWVDIPRHEQFIAEALPRIEEFWLRVQRREPPDTDLKPETTRAIRALWPADTGEMIDLPAEALDLVVEWETAKAAREAQKDQAQDLENKLRTMLRDATIGLLPDGTSLTLKTTSRAGYTVEPCTYRTLRRFTPKGLKKRG